LHNPETVRFPVRPATATERDTERKAAAPPGPVRTSCGLPYQYDRNLTTNPMVAHVTL
jgi:hypothetical protein